MDESDALTSAFCSIAAENHFRQMVNHFKTTFLLLSHFVNLWFSILIMSRNSPLVNIMMYFIRSKRLCRLCCSNEALFVDRLRQVPRCVARYYNLDAQLVPVFWTRVKPQHGRTDTICDLLFPKLYHIIQSFFGKLIELYFLGFEVFPGFEPVFLLHTKC